MSLDTRVGCYAWVEHANKVLLTYWSAPHITRGRNQGWTLPGGGMDLDETPQQTVVREVREETGYDVTVGEFMGITNSFKTPEQRYDRSDCAFHILQIVYRGTVVGGELAVEVDGSSVDARWFARDQIVRLDPLPLVTLALDWAGGPEPPG